MIDVLFFDGCPSHVPAVCVTTSPTGTASRV